MDAILQERIGGRRTASIEPCRKFLQCCMLLLFVSNLGCAQPFRVDARAKIDGTGDINGNINGNIKAELSPTPRLQPVVATGLPHRRFDPRAATVAIVDVDGLLLNNDATGLGSWGENPVSVFRERLDAIECDPRLRCGHPNQHAGWQRDGNRYHVARLDGVQETNMRAGHRLLDGRCGRGRVLFGDCRRLDLAHPTTVTGGIGCILNVYNLEDLMAQFNILGVPIKAGANIDIGSPIKQLSDEKRKLLQDMADEFHSRFCDVVLDARPNVDGELKSTFDGRVFTAKQAKEMHLIDQIGYLDNAVGAARSMAGVNNANVVFYHRREDQALSQYSITPNMPLQKGLIPINVPGLDRSKLPCFLYLWQMEPSSEIMLGK